MCKQVTAKCHYIDSRGAALGGSAIQGIRHAFVARQQVLETTVVSPEAIEVPDFDP